MNGGQPKRKKIGGRKSRSKKQRAGTHSAARPPPLVPGAPPGRVIWREIPRLLDEDSLPIGEKLYECYEVDPALVMADLEAWQMTDDVNGANKWKDFVISHMASTESARAAKAARGRGAGGAGAAAATPAATADTADKGVVRTADMSDAAWREITAAKTASRRASVNYYWTYVLSRPTDVYGATGAANIIANLMQWERGARYIAKWVEELIELTKTVDHPDGGDIKVTVPDTWPTRSASRKPSHGLIAPASPSREIVREFSGKRLGWRACVIIVNMLRAKRGRPPIESHMTISRIARAMGAKVKKTTTRADQSNDPNSDHCLFWLESCKQYEYRYAAVMALSGGDPLAMPTTWPTHATLAARLAKLHRLYRSYQMRKKKERSPEKGSRAAESCQRRGGSGGGRCHSGQEEGAR